jgi:hypothetical protein
VKDSLRKLMDACITREPGNPLWPGGVERFCIEHELPQDKFFYLFAQLVAEEFAHGLMSFADGNRAMNQLFGVADINLRGFAWEVYGAFDSGEFRHDGDSDATTVGRNTRFPK